MDIGQLVNSSGCLSVRGLGLVRVDGVGTAEFLQVLGVHLQSILLQGLAQGGKQSSDPGAGLSIEIWWSLALTQTAQVFVDCSIVNTSTLIWGGMCLMVANPLKCKT